MQGYVHHRDKKINRYIMIPLEEKIFNPEFLYPYNLQAKYYITFIQRKKMKAFRSQLICTSHSKYMHSLPYNTAPPPRLPALGL